MSEVRCPHCGKKLLEAMGSYHISINCRCCKKIVVLRSARTGVELIQQVFENQIAQTGMRVNKTQ